MKESYQIQENRPSDNVLHNVVSFEFFMKVRSKGYKEVCACCS